MKTFTQFIFLTESVYGTLDDAKHVITTLRSHGHQGYIAGGAVRDTLLGLTPKDFDVVTDATPDQLKVIFPQGKLVGEKFGVVIVNGIDVATFRMDSDNYADGRRPDSVEFTTSPEIDSRRRDFTINSMFLDPFSGKILDFHGGQKDLKNKLIRAVGNPNDRFTQDHLRMLRADRFAAKLGFDIHPETQASMVKNAHNIANIDVERITMELTKAMGHDAYKTIKSMHTTGMLVHVLPELDQLSSHNWAQVLATLSFIGTNIKPELGLAAAFYMFTSATATKIGRRLKFTNDEIKHITSILDLQIRISAVTPQTTLDVLKRLMRETFFLDALTLYRCRVDAQDDHANASAMRMLSTMIAQMKQEDLNPAKFVTGDDLIALGMRPSKEFKRILDAAEDGQLIGHIKSKEQALEMIRNGRL